MTPIVYPFELGRAAVGSYRRLYVRTRSRRSSSCSSARSTPSSTTRRRLTVTPLLPHWPYWGYVAYLGMSFALRLPRPRARGSRCSAGSRPTSPRSSERGAAIEVAGVSKHFRLYHEHYTSLKERVIHFGRDPARGVLGAARRRLRGRAGLDRRHPRSQRLGQVDAAQVRRRHPAADRRARSSRAGRVAALLELGAGFHPELTGRENIYLNGVDPRPHEARDRPGASTRSSRSPSSSSSSTCRCGTTRRACTCGSGFAVAVNVDPDILLVDEVLSVGDEAFQRKCLERVASSSARAARSCS